jgi:polysaccharide pyruvyl transferase WcaK-like protein
MGDWGMNGPNLLLWNFSQVEGKDSNLGDRAIFLRMVQNIDRAYQGKCSFLTLSSSPSYTQSLGVIAYPLTLRGILKAVNAADVIVLGGGELIQDKTSRAYLFANLYLAFLALFFGKHFCCYAIGVSEREELSKIGGWITRLLLNKAVFITVRDQRSKERLDEIGVNRPPIHTTADEVLTGLPGQEMVISPSEKSTMQISTSNYVIISPRKKVQRGFSILPLGLLKNSKPKYTSQENQGEMLAENLSIFINDFVKATGANIIFMPFYPEGKYSQGDLEFSKKVASHLSEKVDYRILDPRDMTYPEIADIFSNAELVIGMNLHSIIIATVKGTPAIAISYGSKITNFMSQISGNDRVFSTELIKKNPTSLISTTKQVWEKRKQIQKELGPYRASLKLKAEKNANVLRDAFPPQ